MEKEEIPVLIGSFILIMLIVIITYSFFFDTSVTGKVVSIDVNEDIPQGFGLAVVLIIVTLLILIM